MVAPIDKQKLKPTKANIDKLQKIITSNRKAAKILISDMKESRRDYRDNRDELKRVTKEQSQSIIAKTEEINQKISQLEIINKENKELKATADNLQHSLTMLEDDNEKLNYAYDRLLKGILDDVAMENNLLY